MYWYSKPRLFRGQNVIWQKNYFFSKILKRFISLNKYKTVFLYHQFLNSKHPWASKTMKVIGHTSTWYAVVNKVNSFHSMILKFYKTLNCWKTSDAMFMKSSEHSKMIIFHNKFHFEWNWMAFNQKIPGMNPIFWLCKNASLTMIML